MLIRFLLCWLLLCRQVVFCFPKGVDASGIGDIFVEGVEDENPLEEGSLTEHSKDGIHNSKIRTEIYTFDGKVKRYVYLNRQPKKMTSDETIVVLTDHNKVYITHDQGTTWEHIAKDDEVLQIQLNEFNTDDIFLIASHSKVIYSSDRGFNWKSFRTPLQMVPGLERSLFFHPTRPAWLIWIGETGCDEESECRTILYVSRAYGKRWSTLKENVNFCHFVGHMQKKINPNLIICERPASDSNGFHGELSYSLDFFKTNHRVLKDVIGYSQAGEFLIALVDDLKRGVRTYVSTEGTKWVESLFPADFPVKNRQLYTVLSEAATKSIVLLLTTNNRRGTEYGAIVKSNLDGQDFVTMLKYVNRDIAGFVDFEQVMNLEGVMVANTVENWSESRLGARKKLKTKISFNDGSHWSYLAPPAVDSNGKPYDCGASKKCTLNLHGTTERGDPRDTLSSGSAVGMMIGVGNVGEHLSSFYDSNTYFTRNGGLTWKELRKGVFMWEYGDQGSIIVLVNEKDDTNVIYYSVDQGETWQEFQFLTEKVKVFDILTVPSDNARKFLLFTRLPMHGGDRTRVIQIDFSLYHKRECSLEEGDYEVWSPSHPFEENKECLFGHELQYYRKIPDKKCFAGYKLRNHYKIVKNCPCTQQDFECDFNYHRDASGICRLIPGMSPPDHSEICKKDKNAIEFSEPTGYRKVGLSTCEGGLSLDSWNFKPCPDKIDAFNDRHRTNSGILLVFGVIIGLGLAGYIFYDNYLKTKGTIRLGEDGDFEFMESTDDWISEFKNKLVILLGDLRDKFEVFKDRFRNNQVVRIQDEANAYTVSDDSDEE